MAEIEDLEDEFPERGYAKYSKMRSRRGGNHENWSEHIANKRRRLPVTLPVVHSIEVEDD